MSDTSGESMPEIQASINDIWLEQVRAAMRAEIYTRITRLASGDFSAEEVLFAASAQELLYLDVLDTAIDETEQGAPRPWDLLYQNGTHLEDAKIARMMEIQAALIDKSEIEAQGDIPLADAIDAVIACRQHEVKSRVELKRIVLEKAVKLGIPILGSPDDPTI